MQDHSVCLFSSCSEIQCMCHMFDSGLAIHAADPRIVKKTSHKKSQSPHFRFPLFLFIANMISHNAQGLQIYLGYLWLAGA